MRSQVIEESKNNRSYFEQDEDEIVGQEVRRAEKEGPKTHIDNSGLETLDLSKTLELSKVGLNQVRYLPELREEQTDEEKWNSRGPSRTDSRFKHIPGSKTTNLNTETNLLSDRSVTQIDKN